MATTITWKMILRVRRSKQDGSAVSYCPPFVFIASTECENLLVSVDDMASSHEYISKPLFAKTMNKRNIKAVVMNLMHSKIDNNNFSFILFILNNKARNEDIELRTAKHPFI